MNLFIETPQQRADRRELEERWRDRSRGTIEVPGISPSAREASGHTRYSLEQETYQEELAFHKRHLRASRMASVARIVLAVVLIPLGLAALFVASYAFTCIIDGATPGEVVELLKGFAGRVLAQIAGGSA